MSFARRLVVLHFAAPLAARVGERVRPARFCMLVAAGVLGFALSASMATGQATRPAGADTVQREASFTSASSTETTPTTTPASTGQPPRLDSDSVEEQPIRRRGDAPDGAAGNTGAARRDGAGKPVATPPASQSSTFELRRVALALGAVVGLIFLLHWLARRLFPSVAAGRSSQAIRVLSRSVLAPKQQVLLLRVGKRVIVVGDSGAQMSPLAEITDPDEIASLIAELEAEKRPVASAFGGLFRKAREPFDETEENDKQLAAVASRQDDEQDDAEDVNDRDERDESVSREQPPAELGLAEARGELRGLMERVKELSQQFRRS